MNIFQLKNLNFSYSMGPEVLTGLNFSVEAGERVCILGANGCGKSTLLKILAGLLSPTAGEFFAFGNKMDPAVLSRDESKVYHRRVGYVFQDSDVQLFCSNVREELAFGPLQLGLSHDEVMASVNRMAESLDITKLLDKAPFHLSGGEKKKVAMASTLILDPEVLIMDEPTNDLDPRSQTWLLKLLCRDMASGDAGRKPHASDLLDGRKPHASFDANANGDSGRKPHAKTLIFSTHNLELVPHIADRALLFNEDHQLCADLPVRELLQRVELLRSVNLVDEHFHTHPWDFE